MRSLVIWLMLSSPVWAEWQFLEDWQDPIDGFTTDAAQTINADGYAMYLYRNPRGRVMALYTLPDDEADLPVDGPVAIATPEGFPSKTIEARTEQGRFFEYARSTGRVVRDRLWHGEGQVPVGTLADILAAPSVSLSLKLTDETTADTTWSMDDAGLSIARALGITLEGVPAGAAWEDAAAQSMLAAMTACQFPTLDMQCVQQVTACSPKISQERDIEGFELCVVQDE